jgi:LysR family hydrogen peroxide-inducible transcriptional activator
VVPFSTPIPSRKVALAWRTSFDRPAAVEALAESIRGVKLPAIKVSKAA